MNNAPSNSMSQQPKSQSQSQPQKLSAEIKKTWGKLSDEEIACQATQPEKFFDAVKAKYSINKEEAEKTVKKMEAECAAACNTSDGKSAETSSAPFPKAANA